MPDWLGMMKQGVQDGDSTVAVFDDDLALIAYRPRKNYVKVMSLGTRQKGLGTVLMDWLEHRFIHKREIQLWASPNARGFYEQRGYERLDWGYYRKMCHETRTNTRTDRRFAGIPGQMGLPVEGPAARHVA